MNLRGAIEQQINLGHHDPVAVTDRVIGLYGEDEVRSWVDVRSFVWRETCQVLSADRRGAESRARQQSTPSAQVVEMRRQHVWIVEKGWVLVEELTADDCMARAEHHRMLAEANETQAELYESWAAAIRAAGVATLGEVPERLRLGLEVAA